MTESSSARRSLAVAAGRGAFAAPFFVMPAFLTIDAPDLHQGHGVHVQEAIALALLGAVIGLVRGFDGGGGGADFLRRLGRAGAVVLGVAATIAALPWIAVRAADRAADLLDVFPADAYGWGDRYVPDAPTLVLIALVAIGEAIRRHRGVAYAGPHVALIACVGVAGARLAELAAVAGPVPRWALWGLLAALLLPRGVAWEEALDAVPARAALAVAGVLAVGAVAPPTLPSLLLDAAVVAIAWRFGQSGRGALRIPPELSTLGFAAAAVFLVPAAWLLLTVIPAAAGALASLFPAEHPDGFRAFAAWVRVPAIGFGLVGLAHVVRGGDRRWVLGAGAWIAVGFVGAALVGVLYGTPAADLASILPSLGAGVAAIALLRGPSPAGRALGAGPVVLAAVVGATAGRIVCASFLPMMSPVALQLGVGALIGGFAGRALAGRLEGPPDAPWGYAGTLFVWVYSAYLPMFVAVAYGLHREWVLAVLAVAAVVLATTRVRARWVVYGCFYATFAIVASFKTGPSEQHCATVAATGGADLVFPRFGADHDRTLVEPYDVLPVRGTSHVIVAQKRYQKTGGHLALIDVERGVETGRLRPGDLRVPGSPATWPERMEWDPRRGTAWVQILAGDSYSMWEVAATPATAPTRLELRRRVPLLWEPGSPGIDERLDRLVVSLVPNREESAPPLLGAYDLETLKGRLPDRLADDARGVFEMADYVAVDAWSGAYYVPAFIDLVRFAIVEVSAEDGRSLRRRETFHPTVGLAADGRRGRIHLTNSMASTLDIRSTADLRLLQRLPTGAFPRDVVFDADRGLLFVAGYGDGVVTTFDVAGAEARPVAEVRLGPLLRGLGLDPVSGRVFGASGCGVFEVPTAR